MATEVSWWNGQFLKFEDDGDFRCLKGSHEVLAKNFNMLLFLYRMASQTTSFSSSTDDHTDSVTKRWNLNGTNKEKAERKNQPSKRKKQPMSPTGRPALKLRLLGMATHKKVALQSIWQLHICVFCPKKMWHAYSGHRVPYECVCVCAHTWVLIWICQYVCICDKCLTSLQQVLKIVVYVWIVQVHLRHFVGVIL